MSTRSGRVRQSLIETSPLRTRKGTSPTRSPARNRKSSPTTRSTQKSPSRKSPSRKSASKYPARKSPSRAAKEPKDKEISVPKSPVKRPALKKDTEFKVVDVSSKIEISRSTRSRRFDYSIKDLPLPVTKIEPILIADEKPNGLVTAHSISDVYGLKNRKATEDIAPRRSSRLRDVVDSFPDIRRSISKSLSKSKSESISKSIDTYSDEENSEESVPKEKSQSITRKLSTPLPCNMSLSYLSNRYEFGGKIGSIALIGLIPLFVFALLIICSKSCSLKACLDQSFYKSTSIWFNVTALVVIVGQLFLQAIFLCLPILGTKDVDQQGKKYFFNGFFSSFCTINILFALDYYKVLKIDSLLMLYPSMGTISYMTAVFLAIITYVKSLRVKKDFLNPYGNTGFLLYDFFMGRQIQDYIMKISLKLYLSRVSNITTLIFAILIFKHGLYFETKEIENIRWDHLTEILNRVEFKPTVLIYSMMQIIYALYFITRETKITSTFYWHSEGLGYLQIVSSALYPFYFTSISKYVKDADVKLSNNILIIAVVTYVLGLIFMLISNNIKHKFRKNPLQPSLAHLDSMPTFHGKKLLVSNFWGVLRHPNYTGDILIHIALALPGIMTKQIIAASPALLTILMLVHRAWRDHDRCRRRYGAAWQRYCKKVPSVIIPKIL